MTEAQVEAVARAFCRELGLDPDEVLYRYGPRWLFYREDARRAIAMREDLDEVLK